MLRRAVLVLSLVLASAPAARAQRLSSVAPPLPPASLDGLPPARATPLLAQAPAPRRAGTALVVGEFLAGVVGAWVGGFAGYKAAEAVADDTRVEGDASYSPAGNVGWTLGSYAGAVGASWFVASGSGARRSLRGALAGAVLPSALLLVGVHEPYLPVVGVVVVAPLQAAGAVVGLNGW